MTPSVGFVANYRESGDFVRNDDDRVMPIEK